MVSSYEIQIKLNDFLTKQFLGDGNWRKYPHIDKLFRIYREAVDHGWEEDDFICHIQREWPLQHATVLSESQEHEIEILCQLLKDWNLYERCQKTFIHQPQVC